MKGFEIIHHNRTTIAGTDNGLLVININTVNTNFRKDAFIHSYSVEYDTLESKIWHDFTRVEVGDTFKIEVEDIKETDTPTKILKDPNIVRPISKLEEFYKLDSLLKEKGLL